MAKYGKDYVSKKTFNPKTDFNPDGKVLGSELVYPDGQVVVVLNPHGKTRKYFQESTSRLKLTNSFTPKINPKTNKQYSVSDIERAYRSGYLDCSRDNAKSYKATKK